jgi:hypothetical protein
MPFPSKYPPFCANRGNTIIEYVFIGSLVLVACLGALQMVGVSWGGQMKHVKQDMLTHTQAANTAQAAQEQQIAEEQAQAAAAAATESSASANAGPVETVGANGGTASYASDILTNAQQALQAGKVTQAEYDIIVKLANQGHEIASLQGMLEGAYTQSNGNSAAYANTQLTYNGQSYTPAQLNAILQNNIGSFSALRSQASVLNGVLYDQPLLTSINDSGGNIINNGYASQQQNQSAASFIQYQQQGLGQANGSSNTNQNSATICTSGEHLDSGQHCVP